MEGDHAFVRPETPQLQSHEIQAIQGASRRLSVMLHTVLCVSYQLPAGVHHGGVFVVYLVDLPWAWLCPAT
jgi:hypothetical protein